MKYSYCTLLIFVIVSTAILSYRDVAHPKSAGVFLFKNLRLIDGNGNSPVEKTDMLIQGDADSGII